MDSVSHLSRLWNQKIEAYLASFLKASWKRTVLRSFLSVFCRASPKPEGMPKFMLAWKHKWPLADQTQELALWFPVSANRSGERSLRRTLKVKARCVCLMWQRRHLGFKEVVTQSKRQNKKTILVNSGKVESASAGGKDTAAVRVWDTEILN